MIADDAAIARFRAEFDGHARVSFVRRGFRVLPAGAGGQRLAGQQRHLPDLVRQTRGPGVPEHVARHPAEADGLRHAGRRRAVREHAAQLPDVRLPARREPVHGRDHVRGRLPADERLPRHDHRGGLPAHRPAAPGRGCRGGRARRARGERGRARRQGHRAVRAHLARDLVRRSGRQHRGARRAARRAPGGRGPRPRGRAEDAPDRARARRRTAGARPIPRTQHDPDERAARDGLRPRHRLLVDLLRLPRHRATRRVLHAGRRSVLLRPRHLHAAGHAARPGLGRRRGDRACTRCAARRGRGPAPAVCVLGGALRAVRGRRRDPARGRHRVRRQRATATGPAPPRATAAHGCSCTSAE